MHVAAICARGQVGTIIKNGRKSSGLKFIPHQIAFLGDCTDFATEPAVGPGETLQNRWPSSGTCARAMIGLGTRTKQITITKLKYLLYVRIHPLYGV